MFAQETTGRLGADGFVRTIMTYNETEPFVVTFTFAMCSEDGDPFLNEWEFARELLTEGLRNGAAGMGDVQVIVQSETVSLRLTGREEQTAVISFPRDDVENFLSQSFRLVAEGEESFDLDIEAEWAEWRDADGALG